MIPADLGAELANAISDLVAAGHLPPSALSLSAAGTWRPVPAASDTFAAPAAVPDAAVPDAAVPDAAAGAAGTPSDAVAGSAAARYATSLPFELARLAGEEPTAVAGRLGRAVRRAGWITSAEPTGSGYLTIGVTAAALAAVAVRTSQAGPACVRSETLQSVSRPAPPLPDLTAALSWRQAWRDQAAAMAGRLAEAAGATAVPPGHGPAGGTAVPSGHGPAGGTAVPSGHGPAGVTGVPPSRGPVGVTAVPPGRGPAGPAGVTAVPPGHGPTGPAGAAGTAAGEPGGGCAGAGPAGGSTVAEAVEFAGADAVRYWLARLPAARAGILDRAAAVTRDPARPRQAAAPHAGPHDAAAMRGRVPGARAPSARAEDARAPAPGPPDADALGAPPYSEPPFLGRDLGAVRLAAADAAATGRWAAELGLARLGPPVAAGELGQPAEIALLTELSWLAERVAGAARRRRPDELPRYLERLAGAWLDVREDCPALPSGGRAAPGGAAGTSARLWLAEATATALAAGLDLVGIRPS